MQWIYIILKKYLSGHKNIDLDDFRHPYFNFCLMKKIFFSSSSTFFRMFLEVFSSYSEQWDRWRGKYGKYWNKIEKKTLSSLMLVNFTNFIRVLVSSFFCFGAFLRSFLNLFQNHSFRIYKVKISQLFFIYFCNLMQIIFWGLSLSCEKILCHFFFCNHTSKS